MPNNSDFALAIARSALVDAFAATETAVISRLVALQGETNAMFSQNIAALQKMKPESRYSKATKKDVDQALAELLEMLPLRADIVHGCMRIVALDGKSLACFSNPQKIAAYSRLACLIEEEQFDAARKKLLALAKIISPA